MNNGRLLTEYFTEGQFAKELGKTPRTLRSWRLRRTGPPYVRVGREILYRRESVLTWLKSRERQSLRRSAAEM